MIKPPAPIDTDSLPFHSLWLAFILSLNLTGSGCSTVLNRNLPFCTFVNTSRVIPSVCPPPNAWMWPLPVLPSHQRGLKCYLCCQKFSLSFPVTVISLYPKPVVLNWGQFYSPLPPPGNSWQCLKSFLVVITGVGGATASDVSRPVGMLLNTLRGTRQPPTKREYPV